MPKVYNLFCLNCNSKVSDRGNKTQLIVDSSIKCFSSDYGTNGIKEISAVKQFQHCPCQIIDIGCKVCSEYLGYHVVQPCYQCSQNNDGRYFLFHKVRGEPTDKTWKQLPVIYKEQSVKMIQYPELFLCPICLEKISNPTIISCGHTFCRRCIQRNVDLYVQCPIDKKEMLREGPFIPNRLVDDLMTEFERKQANKSS